MERAQNASDFNPYKGASEDTTIFEFIHEENTALNEISHYKS